MAGRVPSTYSPVNRGVANPQGSPVFRTGFNNTGEPVFSVHQGGIRASGAAVNPVGDQPPITYSYGSVSLGLPDALITPVELMQEAITTLRALISTIKSVLETIDLILGFGIDLLKILIDEVVDQLRSLISILDCGASIHFLVVPPIIPSVVPPRISTSVEVARNIAQSANNAVSELVASLGEEVEEYIESNPILRNNNVVAQLSDRSLIASDYSLRTSRIGGNVGLHSVIKRKLNDLRDAAAPRFTDTTYLSGLTLYAGGPVSEVIDLFDSIKRMLALLGGAVISSPGLPERPKLTLTSQALVPDLGFGEDSTDRAVLGFNIKYQPDRASFGSNILSSGIEFSPVSFRLIEARGSELVDWISLKGAEEIYLFSEVEDFLTTIIDIGVDNPITLPGTFTDVVTGEISVPHYTTPSTEPLAYVAVVIYQRRTSAGTVEQLYLASSIVRPVLSPVTLSLFTIGSSRAPNFISIGGSLWPLLGNLYRYVEALLNSASAFLKGFVTQVFNVFRLIIQNLIRSLETIDALAQLISKILNAIREILSIQLKAAGVFFSGRGSNSALIDIHERALITEADRSSSIPEESIAASEPTTSPTTVSGSYDGLEDAARALKGSISGAGARIKDTLESEQQRLSQLETSGDTRLRLSVTSSGAPYFDNLESVAALMIVGGSEIKTNADAFRDAIDILFGGSRDRRPLATKTGALVQTREYGLSSSPVEAQRPFGGVVIGPTGEASDKPWANYCGD